MFLSFTQIFKYKLIELMLYDLFEIKWKKSKIFGVKENREEYKVSNTITLNVQLQKQEIVLKYVNYNNEP